MEETPSPPILEDHGLPPSSLLNRLTNIFVSPAEVFDEIKSSRPNSANWVVPLVLAIIAGVVYTLVVFSQPAVLHRMQEAQEKKFQDMVAAGKMTQPQADQTIATVQKYMSPGFMKLMGSLGAVFASAAMLFLVALVFWLVGKRAFHSDLNYTQSLEAVGVSTMINVLGAIVAMLLAVIYGNMFITLGPALLVKHFDAANKVHRILSALNLPSLWYVAVLSIGLARFTGASFLKSAVWLYAIWALLTLGPILIFGGK